MVSRRAALVLAASLLFAACDWDLAQIVAHPSTERRVQESLAMPAPEPPVVDSASFRFALFGDPQVRADLNHRLGRFRTDVESLGIDFFCVLGDLTHDATPEEIAAVKTGLDSTGVPYFVTIGNHDLYQADGWDRFKQEFGSATYSVDVADRVRLIFLDTAGGEVGATQFDWLEDRLDDNGKHVKVVGTHFPCYDGIAPIMWRIGSAAERAKLQYLLREYGAWAFVAGHIHGWRHTRIEGVHHFIAGTMSAGGLDYGTPGYLLVTVAGDSLGWEKVDWVD